MLKLQPSKNTSYQTQHQAQKKATNYLLPVGWINYFSKNVYAWGKKTSSQLFDSLI